MVPSARSSAGSPIQRRFAGASAEGGPEDCLSTEGSHVPPPRPATGVSRRDLKEDEPDFGLGG